MSLSWLASALLALSVCTDATHLAVPLSQQPGARDVLSNAQSVAARYAKGPGKRPAYVVSPERLDPQNQFWFAQFDVGASKNLSLLIDTGSSDVAVNPGLYKPSHASVNLNRSGQLGYATTEENGCGIALVNFTTYADGVSVQGLLSKNQSIADVKKVPPPNNNTITEFPGQGIVGLAGTNPKFTQLGATPFFHNLCKQKQVKECRFGLAYGTSGKGAQILGGVDHKLFNGSLYNKPLFQRAQWEVNGTVAVNNTVIEDRAYFIIDSGTANIVGPPKQVTKLFKKLGMEYHTLNITGCAAAVFGYYPCDKVPTVGFQFPNNQTDSPPFFNIEPSAFQQADDGKNNCTAIITGIDLFQGAPLWILGQAWMQGKYVDFNDHGKSLGLAELKDKTLSKY